MITWLQLISMMIQLTISFRLIIIINWNRKNVSLSLQLVRFRFESHSIIIKLRTKKSTNLCFFVNNKDTTETIFFGKSWWRRAFELTNLFFGLIFCFLCVRCFFPLSDIWYVTFWDVCTLTFPFHFIHRLNSILVCPRKKIGILATNSIICKTNSPPIKNKSISKNGDELKIVAITIYMSGNLRLETTNKGKNALEWLLI